MLSIGERMVIDQHIAAPSIDCVAAEAGSISSFVQLEVDRPLCSEMLAVSCWDTCGPIKAIRDNCSTFQTAVNG